MRDKVGIAYVRHQNHTRLVLYSQTHIHTLPCVVIRTPTCWYSHSGVLALVLPCVIAHARVYTIHECNTALNLYRINHTTQLNDYRVIIVIEPLIH